MWVFLGGVGDVVCVVVVVGFGGVVCEGEEVGGDCCFFVGLLVDDEYGVVICYGVEDVVGMYVVDC